MASSQVSSRTLDAAARDQPGVAAALLARRGQFVVDVQRYERR